MCHIFKISNGGLLYINFQSLEKKYIIKRKSLKITRSYYGHSLVNLYNWFLSELILLIYSGKYKTCIVSYLTQIQRWIKYLRFKEYSAYMQEWGKVKYH